MLLLSDIVARGAPVLCLDTCIILDIMRDPTRDNASTADRVAALSLLSAMETKNNLVGLLAAQVTIEFSEHVKPIEEEAERALSKLRDRLKRLDAINVALGGKGATDVSHYGDYVSRSKSIAEMLVAATAPVPQSDETTARAFKRLNEARMSFGLQCWLWRNFGAAPIILPRLASPEADRYSHGRTFDV